MKRFLTGLFLICAFSSCKEPKKPEVKKIYDPAVELRSKKITDSVIEAARREFVNNQKLNAEVSAPVKVTKARLSTDEYGSTDIVVTVKNISSKTVDGIKIKWMLKNNFGETVKDSYEGGIAQKSLRPGKSETYRYSIYSTTATKVEAFVYEAHFNNGEIWRGK